jgi:hypothetical protein
MKVLTAGAMADAIKQAFEQRGHDVLAWPGSNVIEVLGLGASLFDPDLVILFPPCKYLTSSGLHWNVRDPLRAARTDAAVEVARRIFEHPWRRVCMENPVGCLSTRIRRPDQIVQPYDFGCDASKRTCLWLRNLPLLVPTQRVPGRIVNGRERWGNQSDDGQNNAGWKGDRAERRRAHVHAFAAAMADQWGVL